MQYSHPAPISCTQSTKHQRRNRTLYSASALVSDGAAASGASLDSAGAALLVSAVGSASEEVQRVWKKLVHFLGKRTTPRLTYQVVSQELHDQCGVFVAFLAEGIKFCE